MAQEKVTLIHGYKVGDAALKEAVLREPTSADILEAQESAEKLVKTDSGYEFVTSPSAMGLHILCRQIVSIGNVMGPLDVVELKKLHPVDLNLLQEAAEVLEAAMYKQASQAVAQRGRSDGGDTSA